MEKQVREIHQELEQDNATFISLSVESGVFLRHPQSNQRTVRASVRTNTTVVTANGPVDTNENARVNVEGWDQFATAENTLSDEERYQH